MALRKRLLQINFLLSLICFGCGTPVANTPNDPAPAGGTIVATGSFGGPTVHGSVSVYNMGSGSYIIRLVDFSAPNESGLQMIPWMNSAAATTFALRASTGNQNYSFNAPGTPSWSKIVIHSASQNRDIGEAPLR